MKDLVDVLDRVERGLPAWDKTDDELRRSDRNRVRRSQSVIRAEERKRLSRSSEDDDRLDAAWVGASERVDRDLVEKGVSYLPMWIRWQCGGCYGHRDPQPRNQEHLDALVARAEALLGIPLPRMEMESVRPCRR